MSKEIKKVKIKADVFWCQHTKVNDMSGKYQLNLCNLSDAAADALDAEDEAMDDAAAATAPWKAELDSILYGLSCLPCLPHMAGASAFLHRSTADGQRCRIPQARTRLSSRPWSRTNRRRRRRWRI